MNDYLISDNDKQFADEFSRFVNGKMGSAAKTGREWANDHRFLVNEKFKVVMAFMEQLAENYKQGCYDPRDEWACQLANEAIEHLREKELYYSIFLILQIWQIGQQLYIESKASQKTFRS